MKSLEDLILHTKDESNQENLIDPSQRKSHEYLQTKLKETEDIHNGDQKEKKSGDDDNNNSSELTITNTATNGGDYAQKSKLTKVNNIACLAQSLTAYLITVNSKKNGEQLKNLTIRLYDAVSLWISRLFR